MTAEYEFAPRYATRKPQRLQHFIGGDPHDGPMPMDYFAWLARSHDRAVVIANGGKRRRRLQRCPIDSLALPDVDPASVQDVIQTHMHCAHIGNFQKFPKACFHLREPETHHAVGRPLRHRQLMKSFEPDDVYGVVRLDFDGRIAYHTDSAVLQPGMTSGHSAGLRFVKVNTRRGVLVLASDFTHFSESMQTCRPFSTAALHIDRLLDAFDPLFDHAAAPDMIVPGHDPLAMQRYPAPSPDLQGIAVSLDISPKQ